MKPFSQKRGAGSIGAMSVFTLCCGTVALSDPNAPSKYFEGDRRLLRVARFAADFERGDLSGWHVKEAARSDSIQIVTDPVRRGRFAAKFTVRPGDWISNGNRAEVSWDNRDRPGSEAWYGWSFLIPVDYPETEYRPRLWQCLGQWHDQPNREKGETWDTFPGHSPSIALYYVWKEGKPSLELWYGPLEQQAVIARVPIEKGRWNDVVWHIGWSTENDGFVEVWLNGRPITPKNGDNYKFRGANMWNNYPHFLKIGLYRNRDIATTNSVYFDEIRIGNNRAEVDPARRRAPRSLRSKGFGR